MCIRDRLNNVFWFDTIGLGDLTNFWAGNNSADVNWSLGMYMSGFFPCIDVYTRQGMNEAGLNAKWIHKDLTSRETQEFTKNVLNLSLIHI